MHLDSSGISMYAYLNETFVLSSHALLAEYVMSSRDNICSYDPAVSAKFMLPMRNKFHLIKYNCILNAIVSRFTVYGNILNIYEMYKDFDNCHNTIWQ